MNVFNHIWSYCYIMASYVCEQCERTGNRRILSWLQRLCLPWPACWVSHVSPTFCRPMNPWEPCRYPWEEWSMTWWGQISLLISVIGRPVATRLKSLSSNVFLALQVHVHPYDHRNSIFVRNKQHIRPICWFSTSWQVIKSLFTCVWSVWNPPGDSS